MIKALLFDLSRVLLFPVDKKYEGSLNAKHKELSKDESYQFFDHFQLNQELIDFIETLKEKYQLYIFTTETIQEAPELSPIILGVFKKVIAAARLKIDKKEPNSYLLIANNLRVDRSEIMFIDDDGENVAAAKEAGLSTIQFVNNKQLIAALKKI
jgi:HAD superfamily hydrolase (TIGR01509 family)